MRTTVTFASDVAAAVERLQRERGRGVSDAVNELIRRGLTARSTPERFSQTTSAMGGVVLALGPGVWSTDTDFARFPGLRWQNPLSS